MDQALKLAERGFKRAEKFTRLDRPNSALAVLFGCRNCDWKGTNKCPHGLKADEHHSNWICSERAKHYQDLYELADQNLPKAMQMDQMAKSISLIDQMISEKGDDGESIHPELHKIQRNLITLLNHMRKQDEGIKLQGEINHTFQRYDEVVEAQAKLLPKRIIDAEEPTNSRRLGELQEEI